MCKERAKKLLAHYLENSINGDSDSLAEVESIVDEIIEEAVQEAANPAEPVPMILLPQKRYNDLLGELEELKQFRKNFYSSALVAVEDTDPSSAQVNLKATITIDKNRIVELLGGKQDVDNWDSLEECLEYCRGLEVRWAL